MPRKSGLTLRQAQAALRAIGITLRKRDREYRVTPAGLRGSEAEDHAYYTDDLEDAVTTGRRKNQERSHPRSPQPNPARTKRERMSCDQCELVSINGITVHERGCPNATKIWRNGEWVRTYECRECGMKYDDADDAARCCSEWDGE